MNEVMQVKDAVLGISSMIECYLLGNKVREIHLQEEGSVKAVHCNFFRAGGSKPRGFLPSLLPSGWKLP